MRGQDSESGGGRGHQLTDIKGDSGVSADALDCHGGSGVSEGCRRVGRADHRSSSAAEEDCVERSVSC